MNPSTMTIHDNELRGTELIIDSCIMGFVSTMQIDTIRHAIGLMANPPSLKPFLRATTGGVSSHSCKRSWTPLHSVGKQHFYSAALGTCRSAISSDCRPEADPRASDLMPAFDRAFTLASCCFRRDVWEPTSVSHKAHAAAVARHKNTGEDAHHAGDHVFIPLGGGIWMPLCS